MQTQTNTQVKDSKSGVSGKKIAGIVIGSVIGGGILLIGVVVFAFCYIRMRRRSLYAESKTGSLASA